MNDWKSITDDEILNTCCAFGIKTQIKNHQALIKAFKQMEKVLKKRNLIGVNLNEKST